MIQLAYARTLNELRQIIDLQSVNLPDSITSEELEKEGFVTVKHTLDLLRQMNEPFPHAIIKEGDQVVGYALCMQKELRRHIPALHPLFERIDQIRFRGQELRLSNYYVMGQICIAKDYRGQGLFDRLYLHQKKGMAPHFDYVITSVAYHNPRSMRAHHRIGFETVAEYATDDGGQWAILLWDWQIPSATM